MHLLSNEVVQALCWTLIHSLWQGLLLAIAGGIIILLTKKASSGVRYNLLSVLFFLFVITAAFTFVKQWQLASSNNTDGLYANADTGQLIAANPKPALPVVSEKTNLDIFVGYFNEHASLVVTIWFIILSAQCIRLMANAGYAQRIKHYKTHPAPPYWTRRIKELSAKLQIKQRVLLLQSDIVKVPVMVGFLKPVILFPFSLMMQLPPEQVEAVLLHELAHIRRKDYFINMLQHFAEIIFFFNPGVLWISSLIRDERENCCDDIAIAETKSRNEFVHALVSFQEYNLMASKNMMAFPGRKNHLLNRIKRILTNNNKTLNTMEKISLATGIVIISFVTIAFTQARQNNIAKSVQTIDAAAKNVMVNDTIPAKENGRSTFTYVTSIDGKEYRIHEVNDKVTELYVDDTKIPDDKIGDYKEIIAKIHLEAKEQQEKLKEQQEKLSAEKMMLSKKMEELEAEQQQMQKDQQNMSEDSRKRTNENQDKLEAEKMELNDKLNALRAAQDAQEHSDLGNLQKDTLVLEDKARAEMFDALAMKKQQELMREDLVRKKINQEMQEQLNKQNATLMALAEKLKIQQEIMQKESKSLGEKDARKQAEILNRQMTELKKEQEQIQLQRKKISKMLSKEDEFGIETPAIPATPDESVLINKALADQHIGDPVVRLSEPGAQPVPPTDVQINGVLTAIPPVPPLESTKPLKSIINELLDEKIISSRDDLSIELNDETMIVNGVVQPGKLHTLYKKKYLTGKKDHVIYSKHGGSTHAEISVADGSSHADLSEDK